jgi:hypothetical protein
MKALILQKDAAAACATSRVLIDKGFQILCVETLAVAHALIRVDTIDLLVMDEKVDGQLTHSIALSGERHSPYISLIMLTDRDGSETDDLYDLIPCLYALAGSGTAPHVLGQLAMSAVSNVDEAILRVNRRLAAEEVDAGPTENKLEDAIIIDVDPSYADIAIAAPELSEIFAARTATPLEKVEDVVRARIAAILRDQPLPYQLSAGCTPSPELA